jgi:hypothetical protein
MRFGVGLALIVAASGCAGEVRHAPIAAVPSASDARAIEAAEPLPIFRCLEVGRSCWTLGRPCACPARTAEPAAVAYLELEASPVIDYLDFEPKAPIEYLNLEANP